MGDVLFIDLNAVLTDVAEHEVPKEEAQSVSQPFGKVPFHQFC